MAELGVQKHKLAVLYENIWKSILRKIILLRGLKLKDVSVTVKVKNTPKHSFSNIGAIQSGINIKILKETKYVYRSIKLIIWIL